MTYYHAFKIGFNLWYVLLPASLVLCVIVSCLCDIQAFEVTERGQRVWRYRFKERFSILPLVLRVLSSEISAAALCWLAFVESWSGLLQLCDNVFTTTGESGAASLFVAAFVFAVFCGIIFSAETAAMSYGYFAVIIILAIANTAITLRSHCGARANTQDDAVASAPKK